MSRSVSSPSRVQATFAATIIDELIVAGLRDVVVSPGSRSTPLVLAIARRPELTAHVRLDERSAGFFALGRAMATQRPVAIVVTSGTAAAELHACVAEADRAGVPLILLTADRPPELHGVGAPQTINQTHLYGPMVRLFVEPGVARAEARMSWRSLARRLWRASNGANGFRGPVHANLAFSEPLIGEVDELPRGKPRRARSVGELPVGEGAALDIAGLSVLCVCGSGVAAEVIEECRALNWVVLGDATTRNSTPYFDALLRVDAFAERVRPDVVVRLGGLPASKVLARRLREWGARIVALGDDSVASDPDGVIEEWYPGAPRRDCPPLLARESYVAQWEEASARVGRWMVSQENDDAKLSEPLVARVVVAASALHRAPLVVGSSMPVRDVEWWSSPRDAPTYANRGVNGIDGVVSTVMGVAAGGRAIGLVGDLTFLHDVSGLVDGLGSIGGTCALVVVDNDGGGIFSFIEQASSVELNQFESFFATPRGHDLAKIARAFGHRSTSATTVHELRSALEVALGEGGVSVVVASVPTRKENVAVHEQWCEHVATLVGGLPS